MELPQVFHNAVSNQINNLHDRTRRALNGPADKKTDKDHETQLMISPIIHHGNSGRERSTGSSAATALVCEVASASITNKPKRKIVMPSLSKSTAGTKLVPNDETNNNESNDQYCDTDSDRHDKNVTYFSLLRSNRNFRLFLMSYIVAHLGEWLTYLASISAIEEIQSEHIIASGGSQDGISSSRMAVSLLIVIRLLPNVILSPFGGALADGWDRRHIMMGLDVCGSLVAWLFVYALHKRSIPLIYIATLLQECVAGLYEPSRSAIIPLMCPGNEEMKKATTLAGVAWSVIAAFGSAAGGFLVTLVGIHGCYKIDVITYLFSAALMYAIGGSWTVERKKATDFASEQNMIVQGISYVRNSFFGGLVFLKAAAFIICGANDVLNVSFSERGGSAEHRASRLGLLFGSVGVGCFIGPLFSDKYNDMNNPRVIQTICLIGFAVMTVGCIMMGTAKEFSMVLFSSAFRSMGCSVVWINSSLLLQKFCVPDMLGRVASIEYSAALLAEGASAVMAGLLQDKYLLSAEEVSLLQGLGCALLLIVWSSYHYNGGGAASYEILDKDDSSTVSSTDIEADLPETVSFLMTPLHIES
ncbi:hypothetical protein MPSEU_001067700 [Mayamaea pseudoterrestris]|nr:hypothetical protein MPSEU_001067700 [Mayamaea pseudoterrestris]